MNSRHYILDDKGASVEADLLTWANWFEQERMKHAIQEQIGKYFVSTVPLGMDHGFGAGPPLLWETMIFSDDGSEVDYCERYSTKEQAEAGHRQAVAFVNNLIAGAKP